MKKIATTFIYTVASHEMKKSARLMSIPFFYTFSPLLNWKHVLASEGSFKSSTYLKIKKKKLKEIPEVIWLMGREEYTPAPPLSSK